jgi:DDE superfamily endonuclease
MYIWNLQILKTGFQRLRTNNFPGAVGAVDGSHIPIPSPSEDRQSYYNRNKYHSILLQGVCDHRMKFIDVFAGWPGASHDANVWKNSSIFRRLKDENIIPRDCHLIGDSAYPVSYFVMIPYRNNGNLSDAQKTYNKVLSSSRVVIEQAFGLLKGRFRRLKFLNMSRLEMIPRVVIVACMLHNLCIQNNDYIDVDEMFEQEHEDENIENDGMTHDGNAKRNYLCNIINQ